MSTIKKLDFRNYRKTKEAARKERALAIFEKHKEAFQAALKAGIAKMAPPKMPEKVDEVTSRHALLERKGWTPEDARYRGIRVGSGKKYELHTYLRAPARSKYARHTGAKQLGKIIARGAPSHEDIEKTDKHFARVWASWKRGRSGAVA